MSQKQVILREQSQKQDDKIECKSLSFFKVNDKGGDRSYMP